MTKRPKSSKNPYATGSPEVDFRLVARVTLPPKPPGTPDWLAGEVVPLAGKKDRVTVRSFADFDPLFGAVRRHDGRVYIVDRRGMYAPVEVVPEEITEFPRFAESVAAETDRARLAWEADKVCRYALLSAEGKAERLEIIAGRILDLEGWQPAPDQPDREAARRAAVASTIWRLTGCPLRFEVEATVEREATVEPSHAPVAAPARPDESRPLFAAFDAPESILGPQDAIQEAPQS